MRLDLGHWRQLLPVWAWGAATGLDSGEPRPRSSHLTAVVHTKAGYAGRCASCGHPVRAGMRIGRVPEVGWCCSRFALPSAWEEASGTAELCNAHPGDDQGVATEVRLG
jgi:hypothetical protein